jgi:omega-6 fatty acid desaturase (delta-12 desaturase)
VLSTTLLLLATTAGTVWNVHVIGRLACSILSGMLYLRLFVIYHDQQHHAILHHSRLAERFMRIFGILFISPSSVWRSSHNHHHAHNSKLRGSHIGSFPIMTKAQFLKSSRATRFKYLFMRHPLTILFGYIFIFLFGMCVYPFLNDRGEHRDCLLAFVLHLVIAMGLFWLLGLQGLLLTMTIPFFIACAVGSYLFYAQHNFPGVSFSDNAGWTYEKAALESSSFMEMSPIMAWFTGNIGYHHIHHLNARIPFYRLPEAKAAIPELQNPRTTSLHPREIIRCLRLKVWDVEAQQMVAIPRAGLAQPPEPAGQSLTT